MLFYKVRKFVRLSFRDKIYLTEAFVMLMIAKQVIFLVPLPKVAPYFGKLNGASNVTLSNVELEISDKVKWSVSIASRAVPWNSVCLDQALSGIMMLKRKKIPYHLCLGVKKDENNIKAHAWVLCGGRILIGGQRSRTYTIVAQFSRSFDDV